MSQRGDGLMIYITAEDSSVIALDLAHEYEAIQVALELARATGRSIAVRDERLRLIEIIPAASVH